MELGLFFGKDKTVKFRNPQLEFLDLNNGSEIEIIFWEG